MVCLQTSSIGPVGQRRTSWSCLLFDLFLCRTMDSPICTRYLFLGQRCTPSSPVRCDFVRQRGTTVVVDLFRRRAERRRIFQSGHGTRDMIRSITCFGVSAFPHPSRLRCALILLVRLSAEELSLTTWFMPLKSPRHDSLPPSLPFGCHPSFMTFRKLIFGSSGGHLAPLRFRGNGDHLCRRLTGEESQTRATTRTRLSENSQETMPLSSEAVGEWWRCNRQVGLVLAG